MEPKKPFSPALTITIGLVGLCILAYILISNKAIPSLSEYMASSTPEKQETSSTEKGIAAPADISSPAAVPQSRVTAFQSSAGSFSTPIRAPRGTIHVFVASTSADQEQGLSDRDSLPADQGMLFVFPTAGDYAFWMKDMDFPLDMIWIDANKRVSGISSGISPSTYPNTFSPPSPAKYVLELNAGGAQKYGIATGTVLGF